MFKNKSIKLENDFSLKVQIALLNASRRLLRADSAKDIGDFVKKSQTVGEESADADQILKLQEKDFGVVFDQLGKFEEYFNKLQIKLPPEILLEIENIYRKKKNLEQVKLQKLAEEEENKSELTSE